MSGQIVILNGSPRSGKSSVAAAIQECSAEAWINLGVDGWMAMTPAHLRPGIGLRPGGERPDLEPFIEQLYGALYDSIAAHARQNLNVVVDVGHHDGYATLSDLWPTLLRRLEGLAVLIVGVRCPLDTILARRQATGYLSAAPGEPIPAPITHWEEAVHRPGLYDMEVNTAELSPEECARTILARIEHGAPPTASQRLINHPSSLSTILLTEWQQIRSLTYDCLAILEQKHLDLRLPFAESQSLYYQFRCMVGAHESYLRKLESGTWQGFSVSLDTIDPITPEIISAQMHKSDRLMETLLSKIDLNDRLPNGQPSYEVVLQMIKHEMHHHGQLINFIYCHGLPIPPSWQDEWALSR